MINSRGSFHREDERTGGTFHMRAFGAESAKSVSQVGDIEIHEQPDRDPSKPKVG